MVISFIGIVGFIASFTSIISLLPQIHKTYTSKSCQDVSLLMLVNFFISSLSWVVYGILTETQSVWITNIIMLLFSLIILYMKIRYSNR